MVATLIVPSIGTFIGVFVDALAATFVAAFIVVVAFMGDALLP
nr:hypothetical protein [Burkholderia sp. BDU5]